MEPSRRVSTLHAGGDSGWAIYFRALAMREAGQPVTMLAVGDHHETTPEPVIAHMAASARGGHTGYTHIPGTPALREAIARRVQTRTGVQTGPENVIVCSGGQAALFAALMAVIDPGDRVVFIDPYYPTYPGTIRACSGVPVAVAARPEHGFEPAAEDLGAAANGAQALLMNSPNNPTGAVYGPQTLAGIADVAESHDLWLISDEVYETQVWDGTHVSPRALPGLAERTVALGSMSKSHVMTGWRVGWAVGPAELIAYMGELSISTTYGIPGFIQDAAHFALTEGTDIETGTTANYRRRRDIVVRLLEGTNGLRLVPARAAMYAMLDIRATGMTGPDFAWALLEAEGIAVLPGESFGEAAAGHVRLALTLPDAELEAALTTIVRFAADRAR